MFFIHASLLDDVPSEKKLTLSRQDNAPITAAIAPTKATQPMMFNGPSFTSSSSSNCAPRTATLLTGAAGAAPGVNFTVAFGIACGIGAVPPIFVVCFASTGLVGRAGGEDNGIVLLPTGAVGGAGRGTPPGAGGAPGVAGRGAAESGTVGAPGRGGGAIGGRGADGAGGAAATVSPSAPGACGFKVMRTVSFFNGTAGAAMFGRGGVGLGFSWSLIGNFRVLKFHGQLAVSP